MGTFSVAGHQASASARAAVTWGICVSGVDFQSALKCSAVGIGQRATFILPPPSMIRIQYRQSPLLGTSSGQYPYFSKQLCRCSTQLAGMWLARVRKYFSSSVLSRLLENGTANPSAVTQSG